MNRLKGNANLLQAQANTPQREVLREQRESRIAELEERVSIADSEPFRRVKVQAEEMMEDTRTQVMGLGDPVEIYRCQGIVNGVRALLDHFEKARGELVQLQEADDAVQGPVSVPA